jgi:hypothetical protein
LKAFGGTRRELSLCARLDQEFKHLAQRGGISIE